MSRFIPGMTKKLVGLFIALLMGVTTITGYASDRVTYYHNDALGSPVAATNASGELLWREAYDPYGKRLLKQASSKEEVWYTGKQEEAAFGVNYFGARWYDPEIGRFMGIDSAGVNVGNVHSFNRYTYANNNPYNFIDPDGNESVSIGGCRIGLCIDIKYQREFSDNKRTVTEQFSFAFGTGKGGGIELNPMEGITGKAKRGDIFIITQETNASATVGYVSAGVTAESGNVLVDPGNKSLNAYDDVNGGEVRTTPPGEALSIDNSSPIGVKPEVSSKVRFSYVVTRPNNPTPPANDYRLAP